MTATRSTPTVARTTASSRLAATESSRVSWARNATTATPIRRTSAPTLAWTHAAVTASARPVKKPRDYGEEDEAAGGQISNTDGYVDAPGYCTNTCQLRCFTAPNVAWADEYDGNCIFVPENPALASDAGQYDDLLDDEDEVSFKGFTGAEAYCDSLGIGAHLVKVDSVAKNAVVTDIINAATEADDFDEYEFESAIFGEDGPPIGFNALLDRSVRRPHHATGSGRILDVE